LFLSYWQRIKKNDDAGGSRLVISSNQAEYVLNDNSYIAASSSFENDNLSQSLHSRTGSSTRQRRRRHVFNLTEFGAVGDNKTVNTGAFEAAVAAVRAVEGDGGGQIIVGPGIWLTAPFNVTSHMTLFLCQDASIVGIQVLSIETSLSLNFQTSIAI
jgi:polygalacturonase